MIPGAKQAANPATVARPTASWHAWLAAAVGALCMVNSLGNGFVYDDVGIVAENASIRSLTDVRAIWLSDWWKPSIDSEPQLLNTRRDRLYRPLTTFSFAIQYQLSGLKPLPYHAVNIVMHALACALVWRFVQLLWGDAAISLITALLFAVHPVHCEAVANVVGRAETLATLFLLGGLCVFVRSAGPSIGRTAAAAGLFFLALLAKETAISYLPIALLALHARRGRADAQDAAVDWRRWGIWAAALAIPCVVYLPLRYIALDQHLIRDDVPSSVFNPVVIAVGVQRILLPLVILGHYVRLLLVPSLLSADYGMRIVDPDAFDPLALVGGLGVAALLICLLGYRRPGGYWRQAAVASALFGASYVLISNTVLTIGVSLAERLMYWPSVPLIMLVSVGAVAFWRTQCAPGRPLGNIGPFVRAAGVGLLLGLGARSYTRNQDWSSNFALFQEDAFNWRQGSIVNRGYARELTLRAVRTADPAEKARYLEQALRVGSRALELTPRDPVALLTIANVYFEMGDRANAAKFAEAVLEADPGDLHARRLVAHLLLPSAETDVEALRAAVEKNPADVNARIQLGYKLLDLGRPRDALEQADEAARLAPRNVEALKLRAKLLALGGQTEDATRAFQAVIALDPRDWQSYANLTGLVVGKNPAEALQYAQQAHRLEPNAYETIVNLAEAYAANDRLDEAIARFRLIERGLAPDDPRIAQIRERIRVLSASKR